MAPRQRPDRRVVLRYAALQVPGNLVVLTLVLAAWEWLDIPGWMTWAVPLGWVAKDALMFPLVWRAYEPDDRSGPGGLNGSIVLVQEELSPAGWVRRGPELWRAELVDGAGAAVPPGTEVRIVRVEGLVLRVEPVTGESAAPGPAAQSAAAGSGVPSSSVRSSSSQSS
jgi:membrane protein implicated in regulation of membrane protease activity